MQKQKEMCTLTFKKTSVFYSDYLGVTQNNCAWKTCAECTKDYHCNNLSECHKNECRRMSDLVEDILKDGLRSGIPLTIEQKAQLFEVRRKLLEERANMRFRLKELDAMTPKQNVVHTI